MSVIFHPPEAIHPDNSANSALPHRPMPNENCVSHAADLVQTLSDFLKLLRKM